MSAYIAPYIAADRAAILPTDSTRLTFGLHRIAESERWCPAWPRNPATASNAAYTRWLKER
jgi:hypothetical protein